jgi:hypothetical protein
VNVRVPASPYLYPARTIALRIFSHCLTEVLRLRTQIQALSTQFFELREKLSVLSAEIPELSFEVCAPFTQFCVLFHEVHFNLLTSGVREARTP